MIREKKKYMLIILISALILVLIFLIFVMIRDKYRDFKKGVYVRKQVGQLVLLDSSPILIAFFNVKEAKVEFFNWNIKISSDNEDVLCILKTIDEVNANSLYSEKILSIAPVDFEACQGQVFNKLTFYNDSDHRTFDIGAIKIYSRRSDSGLAGIMSISYESYLFNDVFVMNIKSKTDNPIVFSGIRIMDNVYLEHYSLEPGAEISVEHNIQDLLSAYPDNDIVLNPYISFTYQDRDYLGSNPSNSYANTLVDRDGVIDFLRQQ